MRSARSPAARNPSAPRHLGAGRARRPMALQRWSEGADAVIHVAGVVNAPDRAASRLGNIAGTANMLAAADGPRRPKRFVHVSSLAAREPDLSDYGWSKAEAEQAVGSNRARLDDRPPARDLRPRRHGMLDCSSWRSVGLALLPPGGPLSVIEVGDLAGCCSRWPGRNYAAGQISSRRRAAEGGWTHDAFARAIGARGRPARAALPLPAPVARRAGDRLVRGEKAKLTPDRVAISAIRTGRHARPARSRRVARRRCRHRIGLEATAAWYRAKALLIRPASLKDSKAAAFACSWHGNPIRPPAFRRPALAGKPRKDNDHDRPPAQFSTPSPALIEPFNKKGVALSDARPSRAISNGTA
jgi:uncharacterized protein YbjT (DUF2867 family)